MKVVIGADHAGYELKESLKPQLLELGLEIEDVGTNSNESVDYPDFAHAAASLVESGIADCGILICGSANGVSITANKHQGVRCALCWKEEIAALAKAHNNANMIAIPARFLTVEEAKAVVRAYFSTSFEGGRHQNRVDKISCA